MGQRPRGQEMDGQKQGLKCLSDSRQTLCAGSGARHSQETPSTGQIIPESWLHPGERGVHTCGSVNPSCVEASAVSGGWTDPRSSRNFVSASLVRRPPQPQRRVPHDQPWPSTHIPGLPGAGVRGFLETGTLQEGDRLPTDEFRSPVSGTRSRDKMSS